MIVGLLIAATLLLPATASAGDGSFPADAPGSPFPTGFEPVDIQAGDFNGDGVADLALVNQGFMAHPGSLVVYLGSGNGQMTTAPGFPLAMSSPVALAVGYFNADRNLDIAAANGAAPIGVTTLMGHGDGTFSNGPGSPVTANVTSPADIAAGDFNGDSYQDLAVVNYGQANAAILLSASTGSGSFPSAQSTTSSTGTNPSGVTVADLNADGLADLAIANVGADTVTVKLGDGTGVFPAGTSFSSSGSNPISTVVGDFDSDGANDLAIANNDFITSNIAIRLGDGLGSFPAERSSTFGMNSSFRIAVGDFNSDGKDDLALTNGGSPALVRLGAGDGTFGTPAPGAPLPTRINNIAAGDYNGDGNDDLAMTTFDTQGVGSAYVRLGSGTPALAGNLLVNGGFEGAGAAGTSAESPEIPGWQRSGGMTFARYGISPSTIFPTVLQAPTYASGGLNFLSGGPGPGPGPSSASQTVDVSASAGSIDAGLATAHLSAYLGGGSVYDDATTARASFLDANGTELGSFAIGPVTVADRSKLTTLLPRSGSGAVPVGARSVRVTLTATNSDAGGSLAFADNVKLTLDAPTPPNPPGGDTPPPPDTTSPDTTSPDTAKGKGPKRRTRHHTATFRFSSEAGARFECKLDNKPFNPCTSPDKIKHQKLGKHVFKVAAIDNAGNVDLTPAIWRWRVIRKHRGAHN